MAPELNSGEGGGPVPRGAVPSPSGALGLMHKKGREVSQTIHGGRCEGN
jgi:hypothetical protein